MRIAFLGDTALIGAFDASASGLERVIRRFDGLRPVLQACDCIIANLEAPLTDARVTREAKSMPLRSPAVNAEILKAIGVTHVNLANNHIYDYGCRGLEDTLETLRSVDIGHFGTDGECCLIEKDGDRALLGGYCCFSANGWHYDALPGKGRLNTLKLSGIKAACERARRESAYPFVCLHWGEENTHYPGRQQIGIAESIIGRCPGGVSIIGHHPHVIQGMVRHEGGIAAYSLGNFCFDDCASPNGAVTVRQTNENRKGMILIAEIRGNALADWTWIPFQADADGLHIREELRGEILSYGERLESIADWQSYEAMRQRECAAARTERLGRRDFGWLVRHLNRNAAMTVLQRWINRRGFAKVYEEFVRDTGE